jgi:RNase P subunit RPR2
MPYMVMVRCPQTDKAVATGIRCEISSFSALSAHTLIDCPACGQKHRWSINDAWLTDFAYATGELQLGAFGEDARPADNGSRLRP